MASKPDPVDIHVGKRVRLRRTLLGLSQKKLGEAIGLTFQQIQKYERGANRIGSSRLYQLARVLDVPVSYFFDKLPLQARAQGAPGLGEAAAAAYRHEPLAKRETLELVRAYYRITEPELRKRVFELMKALAQAAQKRKEGLAAPGEDPPED